MTKILVMGSVPLASPWNGADKNLARFLVQQDKNYQFIVQTDEREQWDTSHVIAIRDRQANPMPTAGQKLRAFLYLLRHSLQADIVNVVASLSNPSRASVELLHAWKMLYRKPVIHTVPSIGDGAVDKRHYFGDVTVVVSKHTQRLLQDAGVKNVTRIYPPVEELRYRIDPENVKQELKLGSRAVLYAAHYGESSGIHEMIQAFAKLPPELNDAVLVLACRTHLHQNPQEEAEKVRQQAQAAGIADRVRIVSKVEDMYALIHACAVTALVPAKLSSKMDLPLVILESLIAGKPVIVTDVAPMNEALLGDGGYAVPFGDLDALRHAVLKLLTDEKQRGQRGQEAVRRFCAPAQIISQYQAVYEQVLKS